MGKINSINIMKNHKNSSFAKKSIKNGKNDANIDTPYKIVTTKNKFAALFEDNDDMSNNTISKLHVNDSSPINNLSDDPCINNSSGESSINDLLDESLNDLSNESHINDLSGKFSTNNLSSDLLQNNTIYKPPVNINDDFLQITNQNTRKKNIRIMSYLPKTQSNDPENVSVNNTIVNNGTDVILPSIWQLYGHNSESKNWSIESYNNIYKILNASNLWKFLNNFYRMDFKTFDFFLMKNDILPIWEHPKNRDGGICSIRTDINNGSDAVCLIILHMVTNKLYTDGADDINGISCSVRNNWMVIKIWCGFKEDKLTHLLQNGLLSKLNNLTFKHISTVPQY